MKRKATASTKSGNDLDLESFAAMCKALGHPARVRILRHLLDVNQCICGKIVETLPLAQSTVSQHLKSLRQAGFVKGEVDGPSVCYCVDRMVLEEFKKMAQSL